MLPIESYGILIQLAYLAGVIMHKEQSLHPSSSQLDAYALGRLSDQECLDIENHLESCDACQKQVERSPNDSFISQLKKGADSDLDFLVATLESDTQSALIKKDKKLSAELAAFLSPAQGQDEIGRVANYRVFKVLGAGGMGIVLQAEDPGLKRLVALKVMKPSLAKNEVYRQRFLREAQTTASIEHDNIVDIYQVGEDNGVPFLAMPLLKGQTLADWINAGKKLSLQQTLRLGREMAMGLAAAHKEGLIHRDIKPSNLWVEPGGRIKILDFGLARAVGQGTNEANITQTGDVLGTPAYMAPEQARAQEVDHRCDLFSLGCVLHELCVGERPFQGDDLVSMVLSLATEMPKAPRDLDPTISKPLSDLIMRLLNKDASKRPDSAQEVARKIKEIEEALVQSAKLQPKRTFSRTRVLVLIAVGVISAFLVSAIILYFQTQDCVIRVMINDPKITVKVKGTDLFLKNLSQGKDIRLSPGKHTLLVQRGKFKFETSQLILKSGEKVTIHIEVLKEEMLARKGERIIGRKRFPQGINQPKIAGRQKADVPLAKAPFDGDSAMIFQNAWDDHLGVPIEKVVDLPGGVKLTMVLIPPGEAQLGSTKKDIDYFLKEVITRKLKWGLTRIQKEGPPYQWKIAEPFYLGKYEVTQRQWLSIMNKNPSQFRGNPSLPVECVSWFGNKSFVEKLNQLSGIQGLRFFLPSQKQWEYACRAGTTTPWYFPNEEKLNEHGWYKENSSDRTHPVGNLKSNPWGLHDLYGNVSEWCLDWYQTKPGKPPLAVNRGGYFLGDSVTCRTVYPHFNLPHAQYPTIGLRLAARIEDPSPAPR